MPNLICKKRRTKGLKGNNENLTQKNGFLGAKHGLRRDLDLRPNLVSIWGRKKRREEEKRKRDKKGKRKRRGREEEEKRRGKEEQKGMEL